mmetsp:Transcript_19785/g.49221  ORF Transcript_19785/g.49221 Transcript_19785/m.49221 type:complete len:332 (+) Transcript_19785:2787-3782(+)
MRQFSHGTENRSFAIELSFENVVTQSKFFQIDHGSKLRRKSLVVVEEVVVHEKSLQIRQGVENLEIIVSHVHDVIGEIHCLNLVGNNLKIGRDSSRQTVALEVDGDDVSLVVTFDTHPVAAVGFAHPVGCNLPRLRIFHMDRRNHVGIVKQSSKHESLKLFGVFNFIDTIVRGHPKKSLSLGGDLVKKILVKTVTFISGNHSLLEFCKNFWIRVALVHLNGDNTDTVVIVVVVAASVLCAPGSTSNTSNGTNQDDEDNSEDSKCPLVVANKSNECGPAIRNRVSAHVFFRSTGGSHVVFSIWVSNIIRGVIGSVVFHIFQVKIDAIVNVHG